MKLKELFREMQETQMKKLEGIEILGFKTRIYTYSSRGYKNKALYGYKYENGKKKQIFLGKPDTVEEIENKIRNTIEANK